MNLLVRNKPDGLAICFLAAWPLALFWSAALRQAVFFFGDIFLFFYPTHLAYANALREGRLPLWEPKMFAGFPLYAEGQIGALYPLHPFLYGLFPIDLATNYDILFHLAWVAVGMYLFARALGLQRPSALLAALAFGSGGFFVARLQHMSVMATAAWLPWLMWAWEHHERETDSRKRWRWFALLALFSGIQLLGGHPQFAFFSAMLVGLYAVVRWQRAEESGIRNSKFEIRNSKPVVSKGEPFKIRITNYELRITNYFHFSRLIPVVLAFALGAALAAAQLVPTFELAGESSRAGGLLPKFFNAFSLRPIHFLMLFDPFVLGNPYPNVSVEVIGYTGFLALVLALGAPLVRRDRRVVFFALVALGCLFMGLGDQNVFYRGLRYLPLFNYFRVPSRFLYLYSFAAAMLAALTFDYLLARARETAQLTRAQKIVLALFAFLIALIVGLIPALPLEVWLAAWVWVPLIFAFVTAWIILGARRGLFTRTSLATLVLGLTAADLALFAAVYSKTYDAMMPVAEFYAPPRSLAALKSLAPEKERILTSLWVYPWMDTMRESLYPNISLIYGIPNGIGYTPLIPQRTSDYIEKINAPMFNLMNVRYYLLPQLLPIDAKTEGDDLANDFALDVVGHYVTIPPTPATKIRITSSLAQSVDVRTGDVVAQIGLVAEDGTWLTLPLRAGNETAEWAYERSDVRKVIRHAMPPIATTFPARSAFPTEAHDGHTYRAEFEVARQGQPLRITGVMIFPWVPSGLLRVERVVLVTLEGEEVSLAHLAGRSDQTLVYRSNHVAIYENLDVLPRAFLVHDARVADDTTTLKEMTRDEFDPSRTLFLASGAALQAGGAQQPDEYVRIVEYRPERVVLSARVSADAYLVLADAWYPGWVARVDGMETPIHRADLIFRAVRVSPGEHRIEFEYRPMSLYIGAGVSLLALILLGALFARSRAHFNFGANPR